MVITNCPLCNENIRNSVPLAIRSLEYVRCNNCGIYYQKSYMTIEQAEEYYRRTYKRGKDKDRLKNRSVEIEPRSKILEIGCNGGKVAMRLCSEGHFVDVVEPCTPEQQKQFERGGLRVHNGLFENIKLGKEKYDYVIFFEVIEHILKPKDFIDKVYDILRPNGCIYLSTPLLPDTGGEKVVPTAFQLPHITVFTVSSLRKLFYKFTPVYDIIASTNRENIVLKFKKPG